MKVKMQQQDYKQSLNLIKLQVIKKNLEMISNGNTISYLEILFITSVYGVRIPDDLRISYPTNMLIILQYQFENLKVFDDRFSVILSFRGVQEHITIPFVSINKFHDKISGDILIFDVANIPDNSQEREYSKNISYKRIISIDQLRDK
ncbi:ClpXP protease specificity-enhancing factor SspB [Wolbachia endosymbiont of Howardula sp.]|uniref:ClpXP protease specificity-enhancing factor SspB n=1 Tax=Wolbachia endosymbiont of Howardula sp. TaxID=2916816 RepID=UPI00217E5416|nr:ClpXP protease specificity-enhancing factor SspB [Wolbachia endosymbiont of Howardula sp.]UWI83194.1 ClpXP protease specificity-enhancing factor SspB [Wolbachia endosymbiont of Howardula sp.]